MEPRISPRFDAALNAPLFTIAGTEITLFTLIAVTLVTVIGFWVARLASLGTGRAMRARGIEDIGTIAAARRIVQYLITLVVLGIGLQTVGINLTALFAAGAFFAIAVGFAVQNIAQNFVAGMILLGDRTIRTGDVLEVEGRIVVVTRMGLRATVARTRDEEDLIIPNSVLVQNTVTNYTLIDRNYRIRAEVGVAYDSDLDLVTRVLTDVALAMEWRVPEFEPRVLLAGFGASSIDFQVHLWIADPWIARRRTSELNMAIWRAFRHSGVTIAFPQLDLHLDPPVTTALQRLARTG
jgi:small-conductance mechanosensitive channel